MHLNSEHNKEKVEDVDDDSDIGYDSSEEYCDDGYPSHDEEDNCGSGKRNNQESYMVLKEDDILRRQQEVISELCGVLSISKHDSVVLLLNYNWSLTEVYDAWFSDEESVRQLVGLQCKASVSDDFDQMIKCRICYDCTSPEQFSSLSCGHLFCNSCWSDYVTIAIDDGLACLLLRCPEQKCKAVVDQGTVEKFVCDKFKKKYVRHLMRSFVQQSRTIKWCPGVDCQFALELDQDAATIGVGYDIKCECGHAFCYNCGDESHHPVRCDTVKKWAIKNSSDSENVTWIIGMTKPCPKCLTPIEKNQGCMHMTCPPPCCHEFCWLCLGPWSQHGKDSGGFYACNKYEEGKRQGKFSEEEMKREMAKQLVERYPHYFERWSSHEFSQEKAISDLNETRACHIPKLCYMYHTTESQLKFIIDAWVQIIACRRVLKWTYAFGYYIPTLDSRRSLFESMQGQAECALELLHKCVEEDLKRYIESEYADNSFDELRIRLIELTLIAKGYFGKLAAAFENELAGLDSEART